MCACKNLPDGSAPNNPEQLQCDARRSGLMCEDAIYGTTRNGY